nr:MAG TPA: hypothetical protein [Caudoviricetes sp.]
MHVSHDKRQASQDSGHDNRRLLLSHDTVHDTDGDKGGNKCVNCLTLSFVHNQTSKNRTNVLVYLCQALTDFFTGGLSLFQLLHELFPGGALLVHLSMRQRSRCIINASFNLIHALDQVVKLIIPAARARRVEIILVTVNVEALAVESLNIRNDVRQSLEVLIRHLRAALNTNRTSVSIPIARVPRDILQFDQLRTLTGFNNIMGTSARAVLEEAAHVIKALTINAPVMNDDSVNIVNGAVRRRERRGVPVGNVHVVTHGYSPSCSVQKIERSLAY